MRYRAIHDDQNKLKEVDCNKMKWVMIKRSKVKLRGQYCSFELLMRQMNK